MTSFYIFVFGSLFNFAAVGLGGEEQNSSEISLLNLPWLALSVFIMFVGIISCAQAHNSILA